MVMGISQITSLSQACRNLEGSLAPPRQNFCQKNSVDFPAAGKGRSNLFISPRNTCSFGRPDRAEFASANDADFVGWLCASTKESPFS